MPLPRIAVVDYLNARPLVRGFTRPPLADTVRLVAGSPALCADRLRDGSVDAALIPSIEYLRIPGLRVIPGMAISARREARSVLLFSRVRLSEIRSVALDRSSRTSAALVRILLRARSRHRVDYRPAEPDLSRMLHDCDAALLIGDAALRAEPRGVQVYDLASEWHTLTGLPFVFAFWAVMPQAAHPVQVEWFLESKRIGLADRDRIAAEAAGELELPARSLESYLTENIHYDLGEEEMKALWLFYRLARESAIVERATDLAFFGRELSPASPLASGRLP
jgi:chorismate dehydratase